VKTGQTNRYPERRKPRQKSRHKPRQTDGHLSEYWRRPGWWGLHVGPRWVPGGWHGG